MATKEWLNNHAKVTAYLDFALYSSLEKWMKEHKIKKASQALTIILEHYLEGNIPTEVLPERLEQEVKDLKVKVTEIDSIESTIAEQYSETTEELNSLKEEIKQLKQTLINAGLASLKTRLEDIPRGRIKLSITPTQAKEGLTKTELCDRLDTTVSNVNEWASILSLDPDEYLEERTGWKKPPNSRRYFPIEVKDPQESKSANKSS